MVSFFYKSLFISQLYSHPKVTLELLAENSNISNIEFNNENFETCEVTHKDKNYTLWLHSDNVSIYISSKFNGSNKSIVQGPFYSAYKK